MNLKLARGVAAACLSGKGKCNKGTPGTVKLVKPGPEDLKAARARPEGLRASGLGQAVQRQVRRRLERHGGQGGRRHGRTLARDGPGPPERRPRQASNIEILPDSFRIPV